MDQDQAPALTVGERLKQAREARGITLDEIASQTRIPVRHLQHIETGDWEALPAATYSVGFARSYAGAVGLDGAEIGAEVRELLGANRRPATVAEYYEPADPARVPPRALAIAAAVIAVLLVIGYLVFRSGLDGDTDPKQAETTAPPPAVQPQPPAQPASPQAAAGQPVTLTAIGEVWLRVYEQGGRTIAERTLAPGESFQIPATSAQPLLRVGAPESLRVTVGQTVLPPLGPPGQPIGNVSLRPEDLVARAQGATAQPPVPGPGR
ncbi:helix-turn-helix domain-containing protein [Allosphingosinicella sp.]|uniref:helix-turn-helix domain-containing protein n=1 Tax=Allosphingosinicella sp. TaxID=2823234 RepID=UPI002EDD5456